MEALAQEQRNAAYDRVIADIGLGRIGTGADAPVLPPRGQGDIRGSALPIESEVLGAQMYGYGEIWSRPGLDLRTRAMITVAVLTAMRAGDLLYEQLNVALNVGVTPEELHEIFLHGSVYGGAAAWQNAYSVANEVFVARGILQPGSGVAIKPAPPMDREQRIAARNRITAALGVGRIGFGPDAPIPNRLPGGPNLSGRGDPRDQDIALMTADYGYGEVWGRPGLSLRDRSFVTQAMLAAMLENHQFHIHVCNALNIGITREEIHEMLLQISIYHGTSGWHFNVTVAQHMFDQHPAAGGTPPAKQ